MEQQYRLLALLHEANQELDQKAVSLLQVGLVVTALVGGLGMFVADLSGWVLGPALGFFMLMVLLSISTLSPEVNQFPGQGDWDKISILYIQVDNQSCFDQILSDTIEAVEVTRTNNRKKASTVKWSGIVFIEQVFFLLVISIIII